MSQKFTTEDCKKAIKEWFEKHQIPYPGDFKRTKKFKGEFYWIRLFEHAESNTSVKVVEYPNSLKVILTTNQVGKGYLFAFCEDETYGDEVTGFVVVEKKYFEENGCMDSVHFTDSFDMPEEFQEMMESTFISDNTNQNEVRKTLLELGFTESKELESLMNS